MSLEEDFPGFIDGIKQLRSRGFTDAEIDRAIVSRMNYLERSGASADAINALVKGRPGPFDVRVYNKKGEIDTLALAQARSRLKEFNDANTVPGDVDPATGRRPWRFPRTPSEWAGNVTKNLSDASGWLEGFVKGIEDRLGASGLLETLAADVGESERVRQAAVAQAVPELVRPPTAKEVFERPVETGMSRLSALTTVLTAGVPQFVGEFIGGPTERAGYPRLGAAERTAGEFITGSLMTPGVGFRVPRAEPPLPPPRFPSAAVAEEATAAIHDFAGQQTAAEVARLRSQVAETPRASLSVEPFVDSEWPASPLREGVESPPAAPAETPAPVPVGPAEAVPRGRGRPITRPVDVRTGTEGISDDAAYTVVAGRMAKIRGVELSDVMDEVRQISPEAVRRMAGAMLKAERIGTGELTGRRGRPRVPGMPEAESAVPESEIVAEMMPRPSGAAKPSTEVRLPTTEEPKAPVYTLSQLRKIADSKGFDLQYDVADPKEPVRLIGPGGVETRLRSLDSLSGFLETQEPAPRQPVELKVPATGDSAFERAVTDQPLTQEHRVHMRRQKMKMSTAKSRPGGLLADDAQVPATELTEPPGVKQISLRKDQLVGTVEDIATAEEASSELAKVANAGYKGRVVDTPNGYEVAFYKDLTPEVSRVLQIHRRVLAKGPSGATAAEHRMVGRAFGIDDRQISTYLEDHGLVKHRGILGRVFERQIEESLVDAVPDVSGRRRIVNMLAGTQNSGSAPIRLMGQDYTEAFMASRDEARQWKTRLEEMKGQLPDTARAQDLAEGLAEPRNAAERGFMDTKQRYMDDFARRAAKQGLMKEHRYIVNYATHRTDMDAVYKTIRDEFVKSESFKDLDLKTQLVVSAEQFGRWRDAFMRHPTRQTMPRAMMQDILQTMRNFKDVADTPSELPEYIRESLPPHIFVKYFQPRTGSTQYLKDFYGNTAEYMADAVHALHWQPVLNKWDPIMRRMSGGSGKFLDWSEKTYMERLRNSVAMRRPSSDRLDIGYVSSNLNDILGRELLRTDNISALTQLTRDAFLRGTVGLAPDSAVRHATHMMTAWLQNGRFTGPFARSIVKLGRVDRSSIWQEFMPMYESAIRELRPNATMLQKAAAFSNVLTKWALSPIQLSENVSKGMAILGGIEDGVARGLSPTESLKLGFAAASEIVPDLRVTEAYWHGINSMLKSQTTMLPHMRSPLMTSGPLGRLSNIFVVWPTHAMQFANSQIRQAFAEYFMRNEKARLLRWTAFGGALYTMHQAGHYTGINFDDFFAEHAYTLLVSVPFWRTAMNGMAAVWGEPSIGVDAAKRAFIESVKHFTPGYPSWRYGGKMQQVVENIARGYATDRLGHRLYSIGPKEGPFYTSEFGELMRGIGLRPQAAVDARAIARTITIESYKRAEAKNAAIRDLLDSGDPTAALSFSHRYGEKIDQEDIVRELQRRTLPLETQLLHRTPSSIRPDIMGEMEALQ